ncbi:PPOX class F420-dependent oxidoreductase [Rhodococcus sp. HNM0569]|uniref:PPOX class F420-dependent oxidoreductase n=1 Tax=Rhodococcus sp. HNM0569 TaxID=2716340 RepID=UPI00146DC739|nr:PPOX class F420-dependent oxidoreductase [Rhodococcus sp. HNM0569]NLU83522.1 PPOX class F420-dependent oxidoreductase [Rhodococcus sp. HNM0569]
MARVATTTRVGLEDLLDFLRPRHRMILSTRRADGSPQMSPVSGGVDADGRIVISSYPERAKTRNARARPHVDVLVLSDDFDAGWVQISGTAEILDALDSDADPSVLDAFEEYYRSIAGEHPDWAEYRQAMVDQKKSLLRIEPQSWGPIATGGFPPRDS